MSDRKNRLMGRGYTININTKIRLGFFLTVLPLFFIVGATYFPLRNIVFENSARQIVLISSSGQEQFSSFLRTSYLFFREWVEGDVFRLATEFDAWDDLKYQMDSIQRVHKEFPIMLMVNKRGVIIQESRLFKRNSSGTTLIGQPLPYFKDISGIASGPAFVVDSGPELPNRDNASLLLFVHQTKDSIENVNGHFLSFLDLSSLKGICNEILKELKSSSLPGSHVAVVNMNSNKVISYAAHEDKDGNDTFKLPVTAQTLAKEARPGQIKVFNTETGNQHLLYLPLDLESDSDKKKNKCALCLVLCVHEEEIMAKVSGTLFLSMGIAGIGLVLALVFSALTVKMLTSPITQLVQVLQQYTGGDSSVRAEVKSRDEIGYFAQEFNSMLEKIEASSLALQESEARYRNFFNSLQKAVNSKNYKFRFDLPHNEEDDLVASLNAMLETLENADLKSREEDWIKTGVNQLSEQISGNYKLDELCLKAITFIARYMEALTGTMFIRRLEDDHSGAFYELVAAYAYQHNKNERYGYREKEGLLGQVVKEKKPLHLTDIPVNYLKISSSLGSASPSDVLIFPLIYEGEVQGVVELAANFSLEKKHLNLADQLGKVIGVAVYSAIVNDQFKKQSENLLQQQENLKKANRELEEQNLLLQEVESED